PPDLLLIEARRLQLAKDQRDQLLGQVLRAVAGQRDLDAIAHAEGVPRFLPRGESKSVVPEPSLHVSTTHLVGHRAFHEVYTDGDRVPHPLSTMFGAVRGPDRLPRKGLYVASALDAEQISIPCHEALTNEDVQH